MLQVLGAFLGVWEALIQLLYTVQLAGGINTSNSQIRTSTERLRETESHSSDAGSRDHTTSVTSASVPLCTVLDHLQHARPCGNAPKLIDKEQKHNPVFTWLSFPLESSRCLMKSLTQNIETTIATGQRRGTQATLGSPSANILLSIQKSIVLVGELCFLFRVRWT